MFVTYLS